MAGTCDARGIFDVGRDFAFGYPNAGTRGRAPARDGGFLRAADFREPVALGRTGLEVGRLGVASGYWAPAEAIELAFERGCNYFTWGTFIKGRSPHMAAAIRRIVANGERDRLVLAMFSYAHQAFLTETFLVRGLKALGIERADVLVLGYFSRRPSQSVIDGALRLKAKGLVRFLGLSGHNRALFPELRREGLFDVLHVRYSAVNSGAEVDAFPALAGEGRPGRRVLHRHGLGAAAQPAKDACGRGAADGGRLLPLRALAPRRRRVPGRRTHRRTDAAEPGGARRRTDGPGRARAHAPDRRSPVRQAAAGEAGGLRAATRRASVFKARPLLARDAGGRW